MAVQRAACRAAVLVGRKIVTVDDTPAPLVVRRFERLVASPTSALVRLEAEGGAAQVEALVVSGPGSEVLRFAPLPGPPGPADTLTAAFGVPPHVAAGEGLGFVVALTDGRSVALPAPEPRDRLDALARAQQRAEAAEAARLEAERSAEQAAAEARAQVGDAQRTAEEAVAEAHARLAEAEERTARATHREATLEMRLTETEHRAREATVARETVDRLLARLAESRSARAAAEEALATARADAEAALASARTEAQAAADQARSAAAEIDELRAAVADRADLERGAAAAGARAEALDRELAAARGEAEQRAAAQARAEAAAQEAAELARTLELRAAEADER